MGGASRFVMLLTTPFPILLHRPRVSLLHLARLSSYYLDILPASPHHLALSPRSRPQLGSPVSSSQQIHTQTSSDTFREDRDSLEFAPNPPAAHPWPEWSKLIDTLSAGGYFDHHRLTAYEGEAIRAEDEFVAYEEFSDEFVRASSACLAFARDRPDLLGSLSRKDVGVLVENGTAYIFRSALDTSGRMRAFLGIGTGNTLETDKVHLVDLMKYLLSYASNPTVASKRSNPYGELVESSVRYLLSELAMLARGALSPQPVASVPHQFPDNYGQPPRPLGQKIEMKRGDWICSRCGFMNFARNVKCLECEEARPNRQLTGGEWECPQCDFYNYGRNVVCLRCDCKRPGEASFGTTPSSSGWGNGDGIQANKPDIDSRLAANEEKAQRWFSKVSQLDSDADLSSAAADEDFPEIMPLRKGVNRFVVSTRKTPLERRLANSQYQRNLGNADSQTSRVNTPLSRSLDDRTSAVSDADNNVVDGQGARTENSSSSSSSPRYGHVKANKSSFVPFVPLPADKFAKKPQKIGDNEPMLTERFESVSLRDSDQTSTASVINESGKSVDNWQQFVKPSDLAEGQDKEKEQAGKSERWFNKITELHDVTDVTSISDGFPEIMPVRKGENRFVVSKKKDRSLTSPVYKRTAAMEQTGNTNFVPFVPFPPDYFTKKNKQQPNGADSTPASEISAGSAKPEKSDENKYGVSDVNHLRKMENEETRAGKLSLESSRENSDNSMTGNYYGSSIRGNSTQNSFTSQSYNQDAGSTGFSGKETRSESSTNLTGNSQQQADSNIKSGWTGKSLEGSAVQEPDPLDMSEEAKAQRWFRRVALIKDISELSQIPDEDFPSIMPMRKGVNRFVVSKRKTPLERRLTSPQYRRNLPVVSSDPVKKENENS